MPLYRQILDILHAADKRLLVHDDGKLRLVADQIAALGIDGIDSFTPPPEGDMSVDEAKAVWPEEFLWLHPPLGWYRQETSVLAAADRRDGETGRPQAFLPDDQRGRAAAMGGNGARCIADARSTRSLAFY